MEAKKLRIGNYHLDIDNKLYEMSGFDIYQMSAKENNGNLGIMEYQPIPLTEEWLLKFGFTSNPNQNRYELDGFYIDESKYKGLEFWESTTSRMVTTVHQLQNLYFALTGEELTLSK